MNEYIKLSGGGIPPSEKGQPNGVATLDGAGKIPAAQLPNAVMEYKGDWDVVTNTPTLADGVGNAGDSHLVSVPGTRDLGSGPVTYEVGDFVIYSGTVWQRSPAGAIGATTSLNNLTVTAINASLIPASANSIDLGVTGTRFRDAFVQGSFYLGSPALNSRMRFTPGTIFFNYAEQTYLQHDGANGFTFVGGLAGLMNLSPVNGNTSYQKFIPGINNTYDLGTGGVKWRSGYFGSSVNIGAYTLTGSDGTTGQVLTTNGSGVVSWQTPSGGTSFPLLAPNGLVTAPSYAFSTNAGHGFWYKDSNTIGVSVNGIEQVNLSNNGIEMPTNKYIFTDGTGPNGVSFCVGDASTGMAGDPVNVDKILFKILSTEVARFTPTAFTFDTNGTQVINVQELKLNLESASQSSIIWDDTTGGSEYLRLASRDVELYGSNAIKLSLGVNTSIFDWGTWDLFGGLRLDVNGNCRIAFTDYSSTTRIEATAGKYFELIQNDTGFWIGSTNKDPALEIDYATYRATLYGSTNTQIDVKGNIPTPANSVIEMKVNNAIAAKVTYDTAAGKTRFWLWDNDNASLVQVEVGANDSGGTGYKVLRIPN